MLDHMVKKLAEVYELKAAGATVLLMRPVDVMDWYKQYLDSLLKNHARCSAAWLAHLLWEQNERLQMKEDKR